MNMPKLIITADDYGMSPLFNRGTEELASLGLITGISVMIKRPFIKKNTLKPFSNIAIGLHLELGEQSSPEEITSQINTFTRIFEQSPAYLDGHQHCHLTKNNLPLVIEVAQSLKLPVRSRYPEDRNILRQAGIRTPDNFISWHPDRLNVLEERLKKTAALPISELVVHPGYFDAACDYPYNRERENELIFLKSSKFQILAAPFTPTSYSTLR